MTSEPDLVALLYRTDWTRLSLSAEVHRVSTRALRGVPPGVRTVESSGCVLDEVDAPEAVKVAAKAVIEISRRASAGASALTGFLDAVRGKNPPPPQS